MDIVDFGLREKYEQLEKFGDRLADIKDVIQWEGLRPLLNDLSDPQVEREIRDRTSFMNFLGYPEKLPDRSTIWFFRERLSKTGKDQAWDNAECFIH